MEIFAQLFENVGDCMSANAKLVRKIKMTANLADDAPPAARKRGRPPKDKAPKKPKKKRSPTAYLLYMADVRLQLKREGSSLGPKEIMTEIGKRWKDLPEEDKVPYNTAAEAAKLARDNEDPEVIEADDDEDEEEEEEEAEDDDDDEAAEDDDDEDTVEGEEVVEEAAEEEEEEEATQQPEPAAVADPAKKKKKKKKKHNDE